MRLIDADKFLAELTAYAPTEMVWDAGDVKHKMAEMPTVDAVPVVRCGECKHSRALDRSDRYEDSFIDGCLWCMLGRGDGVLPDQFCDYGERKENEQ